MVSRSKPIVLGIESTCDETGVAIVEGGELLSSVVASSMDMHARYGGVIPEIASRAHAEAFLPVVKQALEDADLDFSNISTVAVSCGPGLAGCLAVGAAGAKGLAYGANKTLYGVNHVIAHAAVTKLQFGPVPSGSLALIVSGGHTSLLQINNMTSSVKVIGTTLDDAAGECFDKIARLLGFPYPGGPYIDRYAQQGDPHALKFPEALTQGRSAAAHPYDFSFSGVKTAVARYIETQQAEGNEINVPDVCASLAFCVADVLSRKAIKACQDLNASTLIVGGGFSANTQLRQQLKEKGEKAGIEVRIPRPALCTDNGAMIAILGEMCVLDKIPPTRMNFSPNSTMALDQVVL